MKKSTTQKKYKMPIHELYQLVHEGQDKGIPALTTLKKYGVTSRAYYTQCKNNNLPNWRGLNKGNILAKKKNVRIQNRELSGGSLQIPEIEDFENHEGATFLQDSIIAKEKKSRELYIQRNERKNRRSKAVG